MFPRLEGINFCPLLKAHVLSTKMAITDNVRVRKCHWLHIIRSVFHMTLKKGDNRKNEPMKKKPQFSPQNVHQNIMEYLQTIALYFQFNLPTIIKSHTKID